MLQKWNLNNTIICKECLTDLDKHSRMHAKEWALTCHHYSDAWIRCVYLTEYHQKIIADLENWGYVITTENGLLWVKIKPLGHKAINAAQHIYCINPLHKKTLAYD